MRTGHVKVFNAEQSYGFIVASDGNEIYVAADQVQGGMLSSGDLVEFEVGEGERGRPAATGVKVTKSAPVDNPVGRTMASPPTWDELEEIDRQRRMARRRRR
ncbi:MAG: cold shock domain-containing protein [Nitriliruptoraceae bacterium]